MTKLIDFSSLTLDSLHVDTKKSEVWDYSKISKFYNIKISLEVKSSDEQKKKIRKKLQLLLETAINQFLKETDKTKKENVTQFKNWLNNFSKSFTNFDTFDKLLSNSNLIIVKNNISILKKYLEF